MSDTSNVVDISSATDTLNGADMSSVFDRNETVKTDSSDVSNVTDKSRKTDTTSVTKISGTSDISGEIIYDTAMVSSILGVQDSTIRKYCVLMQKHNYVFNKNSVGHRIFYKRDIETIKKIVDLKNSKSVTLNEAVKTVLDSDINDITGDTPSKPDYNKLLEQFEAFKNEQMVYNQKLLEKLEQQNDYIKNSLEARDRKLVQSIRESMAARKELAMAVEEVKKEKEKKKKPFFKFW